MQYEPLAKHTLNMIIERVLFESLGQWKKLKVPYDSTLIKQHHTITYVNITRFCLWTKSEN